MLTADGAPPSSCISPEVLAAYVEAALTEPEYAAVEHHVAACARCRGELSAAIASRTPGPEVGDAVGAVGPEAALGLTPGAVIGRYRVVGELGRGAMGVVLRAHDPDLRRDVALKVLPPRLAIGDTARERLRREAQAMARLAHPNVVRVYDVMTEGAHVAVAMELIDGGTLRAQLQRRPGRHLLAACLAAGRGLAAAHRSRLVHRDFKPENVLCAEDGRVLVSDFGLARAEQSAVDRAGAVDATAVAGTPAYLAPEVWAGGAATAASDQFAWAVTTYEAMTGARPYVGTTAAELCHSISTGEVRAWPGPRVMSGRVRGVLRRALSTDPARRFPTMDALLNAIAPRRRTWLWGTALAVAAALGAALLVGRRAEPACSDRGLFAWPRAELVAALGDGPAAQRAMNAIDRYERTWRLARRESCEATRVRGELSETVLAARLTCLDRGYREFVELTGLIAREPSAAARAVEAAELLPDPRGCTPMIGAVTVDPEVVRARSLMIAGQYGPARELADAILARRPADAIAAQALLVRGQAEARADQHALAEATLTEAVVVAERAQVDPLVAEIWIELAHLTGARMHRFDAAAVNQRAAEAAFARAEPGPSLRLLLASVSGANDLARGDPATARRTLERALEANPDAGDYTRGAMLGSVCLAASQVGDLPAARRTCEQAVELLSSAVGAEHPTAIEVRNSLATVALAAADTDGALAQYRVLIELLERTGESPHILALAYSNTGVAWTRRGDLAQARQAFTRAIALFDQHLPDHAHRTLPLQGLATIELAEGNVDAAIAAFESAAAVSARVYGPGDTRTLGAELNLALAVERSGKAARAIELARALAERARVESAWAVFARARELEARTVSRDGRELARAIALRREALAGLDHGDEPATRAELEAGLGEALRASGRAAEAIAPLERAVTFYRADNHPFAAATARWSLGRALWDTRRDRPRAVALVAEAGQLLSALRPAGGPQVEQLARAIDAWLRAHRA